MPLYSEITLVDSLYDKTRNYMTKKPYSKDKIKLNFENSHFMSGWAQDYETKGAMIFEKNGKYFLGIIDKKLTDSEKKELESGAGEFYRMGYDFQKPDNKNTPRLFIRSKGESFAPAVEKYNLPIDEILEIYDNGYFKTQYKKTNEKVFKESLVKLIDYFKLGFLRHESYKHYIFNWKSSELYEDISEFYHDTIVSCYNINKVAINEEYLMELVKNGRIYLFQIYNKDFSEHSHGTPNLHTMYFKALFDERNLADVVYALNGQAEMFFRKASIERKVTHPAKQPIANKNPENPKKTRVLDYDLIKDKRFTQRQFSIHIPVMMNFKAPGYNMINYIVRQELHDMDDVHVIGIDRGERNLIYICVINGKGEIVEQCSLNEIISDNNYKVDYHNLLDRKEKERDKARKSWSTVENIKELKEGYVSQVVHKICELVVKYDAVIGLEDLNSGFKNNRIKVEKQVYQKFEKMLTDKLAYLVDKKLPIEETGGLLHAYQLTNGSTSGRRGNQDGIIFYIPAWLTSKIDPTTGFADLVHIKYASADSAKEFFSKFDDIRYNEKTDMFEFDIDFSKFPKGSTSFRKNWTICTNSDRIRTFRNPEKNNEWDNETVVLTEEFKKLFEKAGVDIFKLSTHCKIQKFGYAAHEDDELMIIS